MSGSHPAQLLDVIARVEVLAVFVAVPLLLCLFLSLRHRRRRREARCPRCHYPVAMLTTPCCPECGNDSQTSGIMPAGEPRPARFLVRMGICTAAMAAIGLLLTGPGADHVPQPYVVGVLHSNRAYAPGEHGPILMFWLGGTTIRWPWQAPTVTADIRYVQLFTYTPNGICARALLASSRDVPAAHYTVDGSRNAPVAHGSPVDAQAVAEFLRLQGADELPLQTAQDVMAEIAKGTVTGRVMRARPDRPFSMDRYTRAYAIPDDRYAHLVPWCLAYLCVFIWIAGMPWFWRRWQRKALAPWSPAGGAADAVA